MTFIYWILVAFKVKLEANHIAQAKLQEKNKWLILLALSSHIRQQLGIKRCLWTRKDPKGKMPLPIFQEKWYSVLGKGNFQANIQGKPDDPKCVHLLAKIKW